MNLEGGGLRLVGVETVDVGAFFGVEHRRYVDTAGSPVLRSVVRHPGAVAVVPVEGGRVWLIRQWRVAVGSDLLEIPAGIRDVDGEDAAETARRECREEIGRDPGRVTRLVEFYNSPGFTDEHTTVFLAEDLQEVPRTPHGAEERAAEVVAMEVGDILAAIEAGRISDGKSVVGLLAYLARGG